MAGDDALAAAAVEEICAGMCVGLGTSSSSRPPTAACTGVTATWKPREFAGCSPARFLAAEIGAVDSGDARGPVSLVVRSRPIQRDILGTIPKRRPMAYVGRAMHTRIEAGGPNEGRSPSFFPGDSEMAGRMRAFDWSRTDLGPSESWPENLRLALGVCLTSRFPILLWWGPRRTVLYNDAYVPFLGASKHPRVLGVPGRDCWPEIWDTIGPMLDGVFQSGTATWSEDRRFFFARTVPREEVYVTFTCGPILSADGSTVDGVFCPCTETTDRVVGARRLETLRQLGLHAASAASIDLACERSAIAIGDNPHDIPFAAVYLVEDAERAVLKAVCGFPTGEPPLPAAVSPGNPEESPLHSSLARVLVSREAVEAANLTAAGLRLPSGPWPEPASRAIALPLANGGADTDALAGILLLGVSPRRPFDAEYRSFLGLVAGHLGTAISAATAHEAEHTRAEALAEIDRDKSEFFSHVSHEFVTPLTLMLGPLNDLLERGEESITASREELELIQRNCCRLQRHVNNLRDFSNLAADRMEARLRPTDLAGLTVDLASLFRSAVERAGLRLTVDCPPLSELVAVDRGMWEKIVLNLLSNAFKFTLEGGIDVSLRLADQAVELSVADTGIGIAPHDLPHIFERFHRVDSAGGRTDEGSGIGLAVVRELVRIHGGSVRVESALGAGSRFVVALPMRCGPLPEPEPSPLAPARSEAQGYADAAMRWLDDAPTETRAADETAPRVLVVDDNADLRAYVQRVLRRDYHVDSVADGEAALAAALESPPDLIISDIRMPGLGGFGLLRALRNDRRTRAVPVILLSAQAGEESSVEDLTAGADDYLVKPFSARELRATVATRLNATRLAQELAASERDLRAAAERAETRTRDELALELCAMTRLHQLSTRLFAQTDLDAVMGEVLEATMSLQGARMGLIELFAHDGCTPGIAAARGFDREVLDRLGGPIAKVARDAALRRQARVLVEDVGTDPAFAAHAALAEQAGFRALQSTPMLSRGGDTLGVLSTYFSQPHRPAEPDLRMTDLYARQAAEAIERSRASEALRVSEERFRRVFQLGLVGMAITSPLNRIIEVNQELCRMLGYSREELLAKSWAEMTHPKDVAAAVAKFDELVAGRLEGYSLETRWIRKNGEVIHTIMSASGARAADGSIDYVVGLVQDITARKHAEEDLRRAAADLAEAQRVSHTGSWSWRPETGENIWSEELYRIFGLPASGRPPRRAAGRQVHRDDAARVKRELSRAIRGREPIDIQYRIRLADNSIKYLRLLGRVVDLDASELEYRGVVMDVTEEKRREAAMDEAQAEVERVTRQMAMGEVAAAIAHEINQPLGAIVNNANACLRLLDVTPPPEDARDVMQNIVADAQRASAIVQHIRALTRSASAERTSFTIGELIGNVLQLAERQLADGRVVVKVRVADGLPPFLGSRVQMQQLLLNLLLNGIEAMADIDDARRVLTIDAEQAVLDSAPAISISVTDVGIGFDPGQAERLFKPFYTTKRKGMGMGLRIGHSIAEAHGGRLQAISAPGAGATFQCILPLED